MMVQAVGCAAPSDIRDQLCPCADRVNTLLIDTYREYPGRGRSYFAARGQNCPCFLQ